MQSVEATQSGTTSASPRKVLVKRMAMRSAINPVRTYLSHPRADQELSKMAQCLNIPVSELVVAIETLIELGIVEKDKQGRLVTKGLRFIDLKIEGLSFDDQIQAHGTQVLANLQRANQGSAVFETNTMLLSRSQAMSLHEELRALRIKYSNLNPEGDEIWNLDFGVQKVASIEPKKKPSN